MANKKISFEFDIDGKPIDVVIDKTLNLRQAVRELTKEINKTQEGTKEFELLSAKLNETKDNVDRVKAKSMEFFNTLSLLPGPVGELGNKLDSSINLLKTFSGFKLSDVTNQAKELVKDFGDILKNISDATGITKVYTVINNTLSKSFVSVGVGEAAAAAGARAFAAALTATGIGALVVLIGTAVSALMEFASGEKASEEATKSFNDALAEQQRLLGVDIDAIDMAAKAAALRAKIAGKSEEEIADITKKANEEKLQSYRDYDEKLYKAQKELSKNDKINGEQKLKENADINAKLLENSRKITAQILSNQQFELETQLAAKTKADAAAKAAADKAEALRKQRQDKIIQDTKTLVENEKQAQEEVTALTETNEKKRAQMELQAAMDKEIRAAQALKIDPKNEELRQTYITEIKEKYRLKTKDSDKKFDDEALKASEDFNKKVSEIRISTIKDETDKAIAERQQKYTNDLADLEKDKEFIKKSEEEKTIIRKDLAIASENDINKIKVDAKIKAGQDELAILEAQQKTLIAGTQAYTDNAIAIENQAYALKLANAKDNAKAIEAINIEHAQNLKNIDLAAFEAKKQIEIEKWQVVAGIGASLQALAGKNKELAIAGIVVEKAAAIGQIWANNAVANAKAVAAMPLTFGQPWVTINTVAAALSTAATVAAAAKAIGEINGQSTGGGGATSTTPAANSTQSLGRNYGDGGMIEGPLHASGGVPITAEGGEAIMARGAVTMFAPLLSAMNQMGGGTSFSKGAVGKASYDTPKVNTIDTPIIKTYVVSNELTSSAEKQARLKDLSTL